MGSAADLVACGTQKPQHSPDDGEDQTDRPQQRDAGQQTDEEEHDSEDEHGVMFLSGGIDIRRVFTAVPRHS
jgi:hypothetical protein